MTIMKNMGRYVGILKTSDEVMDMVKPFIIYSQEEKFLEIRDLYYEPQKQIL